MEPGADIALVTVDGDLDVVGVGPVRSSVERLLTGGCRRIILNMAKVGYIDSSGVGLVLVETRRARERGALLSMVNVGPRVMRTLSIARIVDLIPVSGTERSRTVSELDPTVLPTWRTTVAVDTAHLDRTRAQVGHILRRLPLTPDEVFDVGLAVGEAVGNAVDHACGTPLVQVSCYRDRVVVDVTDCGCGFSLDEGAVPPASSTDERGRGIQIMRLLTDSVTIRRRASGLGTRVRIVKLFSGVGCGVRGHSMGCADQGPEQATP